MTTRPSPAVPWLPLALLVLPPLTATAQCRAGRFEPVWQDDFNGSALDTSRWRAVESDFHGNNEQQYYHPSAVSVAGGHLVITTTNQPTQGWPYTSGLVDTRNKFSQAYGRWEVRARLPSTQGIWPAIWLLPDTGAWPPEIDIMELLGHEPTKVYFSNHWGLWPEHGWFTSSFTGPNFATSYHTFACEWYPGRIDFFVDGVKRASHTQNIPQVPMYLLINTAVGGYWPGYPDATTVFPQTLSVDSVRVYRYIQPDQTVSNPGYEAGLTSWTTWGNAYTSNLTPRTGALSGKMFGNFTGSPNTTGVYQQVPVVPRRAYSAQVWWRNDARDRMAGANYAETRLEFYTSGGTLISAKARRSLDANTPVDQYRWVEIEAVAPVNAASARVAMLFYQPQTAAGAAFFDDVLFGPLDCPSGLQQAPPSGP